MVGPAHRKVLRISVFLFCSERHIAPFYACNWWVCCFSYWSTQQHQACDTANLQRSVLFGSKVISVTQGPEMTKLRQRSHVGHSGFLNARATHRTVWLSWCLRHVPTAGVYASFILRLSKVYWKEGLVRRQNLDFPQRCPSSIKCRTHVVLSKLCRNVSFFDGHRWIRSSRILKLTFFITKKSKSAY